MKFGGTSVADSQAIERVMTIVRGKLDKQPIIVVSALSKVTDALYKICDFTERGDSLEALMLVENIRERHLRLVDELVGCSEEHFAKATAHVNDLCDSLRKLIEVICDLGELSQRSRARIISNGEYLSSGIICHALNASGIATSLIDAREIIITDDNCLKGEPDLKRISEVVPEVIRRAHSLMGGAEAEAIITQGFVSASADGVPTVLGRGGSDYTASIIGMAVDAREIEIWTDVDGVQTADPRKVEGTRSLDSISYTEAAEMAHSGAKVLHPSTIEPAVNKRIPISVLNSRRPECRGTRILQDECIPSGVKSISCKENVRLVNIFSARKFNSVTFASKTFALLASHNIPVDMITVSESTVTVSVAEDADIMPLIEQLSGYATVYVESGKSQVSLVGKDMAFTRGVCQKVFGALQGVTIYMISQGASGNVLSMVIDRTCLAQVMNDLHKVIFEDESSN